MGRVTDKVALVTGASQGLGLADAQVLAREGATVIMTDIRDAEGEAAAAAIREGGGDAAYLHLDVSSEAEWKSVLAEIRERHGRLDILVNNAGMVQMATPEDCSLDAFRLHNAVMNEGVFLGCREAIPLMSESGGGSIINMSSTASHLGYPIFFAYSAAKGAVRSMTKALAVHCQMNGYNIRVNSLHPGAIDTPMVENTTSTLGIDKKDISPVVGLGTPEDVANVVLFLASDESRFVNGTEILIDNALSIQ
ncbi:MAG: SDR family oxidoreductase [Xanthomonadales bacterium]|nr:SDR family oxidoreductase [Xanthomonadales bacterium]NIN59204.1 SDR family oxidoreductase [Xanthomonadales bacterium]NIN74555.1 SDR family oxidoreductase [Xanthomonadales bacterium]NIO13973.1 SDR family oxidoreductase [Xanthomonadales bacterium]NIP11597.1 SDR family oxidoreductase [Xanthomonadales bacterium]